MNESITTCTKADKVCYLVHLLDREKGIFMVSLKISTEQRSRAYFASAFVAVQCVSGRATLGYCWRNQKASL